MADLIRRSDVIGLLEDMLLFGEYDIIASSFSKADEEKAYRAINDIPAVNRWIPCNERMPENNVPVLYVWRSQNGAVAVLHGWHFEIRSLGSAWHQSGMGMHRPDEEVTHWMPLPEPPEKE